MKKLFVLFLLLGFVTCLSYSDQISVRVIINSVDVISPDGETKNYTKPEDVPNIDYSYKVIANGMLILNYHSVGIMLKNRQGLLIARHPITNLLIFSKVEGTRPGPIVVTFDSSTIAQMTADTIFTLKYDEKDNSVTMGVVDGHATLKISGEEAEQFEYFTSNDLVVYKNPAEGIMPLINKIKDTVEFRNSTEWIIDNHYRMELECFKTIDSINNGHSYPLVRGLLIKGRDNTIMNAESYFNDIRTDVLGLMNSTAANFGIVPPDLSLNDFSYFLCLKSNKFSVIEPIMDQALSGVLQYVVTMTQDGSHGKESGLRFHIHDYVREKRDTLILKSIIFAVIELMNRFMEYVVNNTDIERNRMKWKAKSEGIK